MIFVDTNILIDILAPGQAWHAWSAAVIERFGVHDVMLVDQIVLAELASGFSDQDEAMTWLTAVGIEFRLLDETAAFESGRAFRQYRRAERDRTSILSDFLIGGHARYLGASLLTRDTRLYRTYFPDLALITPETHP